MFPVLPRNHFGRVSIFFLQFKDRVFIKGYFSTYECIETEQLFQRNLQFLINGLAIIFWIMLYLKKFSICELHNEYILFNRNLSVTNLLKNLSSKKKQFYRKIRKLLFKNNLFVNIRKHLFSTWDYYVDTTNGFCFNFT